MIDKECRTCKEIKSLDCFRYDKRYSSYSLDCNECWNAKRRARYNPRVYKNIIRAIEKETGIITITDKDREYWQKCKMKRKEYQDRYRARKDNIPISYADPVDYTAILERDGLVCHLCALPIDYAVLTFDHIVPLSQDGPHHMDNIKPAHRSCNSSKGNSIA